MIDVLLVDDHELVRTGIKRLLNDVRGIRVYEEAESGEAALQSVRRQLPDVVLMDVNMPGMGGLEATRRLKQLNSDIKVIILTVHTDDPYPTQLMKAGARGYLTKGCSVDEMVNAIRHVHVGERYISPMVAQSVVLGRLPGKESPLENLSQRELQVLMMLTQGDKIAEISEKLSISPKTVSTYRVRLHSKLGVRNDAELALLAMKLGLIPDTK